MCIIHNYEIIEYYVSQYFGTPFDPDCAFKKVCLKCGKIVDGIKKMKERETQSLIIKQNRQQLAKEMVS